MKVRDSTKGIGEFEKEKPKPIVKEKEPQVHKEELIVKALDRIP